MTLNLMWIRFVVFGLLGASFSSPCWGQEQKSPTASASPTSQNIGLIDQIAALQREVETLKQKIASLETAGPPSSPAFALPIGIIVSYWGSLDELPKGYELCDGELVTTPDSPINGKRKPRLVDTFIKGAMGGVKDVREKPETGGSDSVTITHSHGAGTLFADITQKEVSGANFNIPHVTRGSFTPTNGGWNLGGFTWSAISSGRWSGKEDNPTPPGTAVEGETATVTQTIDVRPKFVSLFYIIKVK